MFAKWSSPEEVFRILTKLSEGQPCDISGIDGYRQIDDLGGIQWPCKKRDLPGLENENQRRLFSNGEFFHPNGRAKFLFADPVEVAEPTCDDYPFVLLSGRGSSAQWHTQTRTKKSAVLRKLYPQSVYVEIHPDDAERLGIDPNSRMTVKSRRADVSVTAMVTPTVQPGQLFIPMHYAKANRLTQASFDPYSRQPSYKFCAVRVEVG